MASTSDYGDGTIIYPQLNADDSEQLPMEMESMCVNCEENGVTRLLLTKIPFYKEIILMSFQCEHCGYRNNEFQSGGKVQEQGERYVVKICNKKDLNRQIVKSEYAGVSIPEVDFEIPPKTQAGEVTTVEGIIRRTVDALKHGQNDRKVQSPTKADQIDEFIKRIEDLLLLEKEFTLIIDDPSGNSFVENPTPSQVDQNTKLIHYQRNLQQNKMLALIADDVEENEDSSAPVWESKEAIRNEVLKFQVNCPNCQAPAETNMKFVNIPYFKEVVIMATNCNQCGHRTSEVKSGGGFADKGTKMSLKIETPLDLTRDILKSETCNLSIPELELEVGMGIISGRFTTVEGLLTSVRDELLENGLMFALGDSAEETKRQKMNEFLEKMSDVIALKIPVHLILDDPAGNSFIQSLTDGPDCDKQLSIEKYERSFEQNESLGLNDMVTDNYENTS